MRLKYGIFVIIPLVLMVALFSSVVAQNGDVVLTIALQEWQQDAISDQVLADFKAENPGINVVPKYFPSGEDAFYSLDLNEIDESLNDAEKFFSTADILVLNPSQLSVEMTRAGYVLDLTPMLNSDPEASLEDFYPSALQSFQWDGSTWGLPVSTQMNMVIYEKTAFDAAGLAYPDETWTLEDYFNAGRALTVRDASGSVTVPGFYGFDERALYRAILGHGLYDPMAFPETPMLDNPELAVLMSAWDTYNEELFPGEEFPGSGIDWDKIPLTIQGIWRLGNSFGNPDDTREWGGAMLPGGGAVVTATGFAISSGTQHPEIAYKLMQFLTKSPEAVNRFFGDTPARRSLVGVEAEDNFIIRPELTPEVHALVDQALENGISASELRFMDYLWIARSDEAGGSLEEALQNTQELALSNLEKAAARRETAILAVPTAVPTPVLNEGEVSLHFLYFANMFPISNRDRWDAAIQAFVDSDPEVGQIEFDTNASSTEEYQSADCYYTGQNSVPYADLTTLLPLDPLIASDPNFDESDIMANAMTLVQREGKVWALPMHIQPAVIWYNANAFAEAGAFEPYIGWNNNDFETALRTLKDANPDVEPFIVTSFGNSYLLTLVAAYGGMPVDYTANPTTYTLTDPVNVEAIRQVLTLAKDGLIKYQALDGNSFGGGGGGEDIMYDAYLSTDDWRIQQRSQSEDPYKVTLFPRGTQYQPLAYSMGTGTINANTQYPEACYRWLNAISNNPELYTAMPVRRSMLDNPALRASLGEDVVTMYAELAAVLESPDLISMPGQFGGGGSLGSFILDTWMNRAFDHFVLEDADLETELQQAQSMIEEFNVCTQDLAGIEEMTTMTPEESEDVFREYVNCGITLDPSLESRYSFLNDDED